MKERPILMSAPMVLAVLNGTKTQTRRVMKLQPHSPPSKVGCAEWETSQGQFRCPYGIAGDRLWVRETFQFVHANSDGQRQTFNSAKPFTQHDYRWIEYAATPRDNEPPPKWKPSIFMPRWANRITLEIVSVRVERLQDISEEDAISEGIENSNIASSKWPWKNYRGENCWVDSPLYSYQSLWESINGKGSWAKNHWLWVIEFKKI